MSSENPKLLPAALEAWGWGWSIIPIGENKRAAVKWEPWQVKRPDQKQLLKWFATKKYSGMAVVCGPVSGGLVVRDFDDAGAYEKWVAAFPELAKTLPASKTARGYHVFFRNPLDKINHLDDGSGEVRGAGYVVLPPSRHPSDALYTWVIKPKDQIPSIPDIDVAGLGMSQRSVVVPEKRNCPREAEKQRIRGSRELEEVENSRIGEFDAIAANLRVRSSRDPSILNSQFLATIPQFVGERNQRLFQLARLLKSLPQFQTGEACEKLVHEWHRLALPHIGTESWEVSWGDFLYAFDQVKYPLGTGLLEHIVTKIPATVPDKMLPLKARQYEGQDARRLVLLCRELQKENGAEPFYLSAVKAIELLGVTDDIVQRKRFFRMMSTLLVHDGILQIVKRGTARTATRYRYIADEPAAGGAK